MMWICIITWPLITQKFQNPENNTDAATSFLPYQTKVKAEAQIRFFQAIFFFTCLILPQPYFWMAFNSYINYIHTEKKERKWSRSVMSDSLHPHKL